MTLVSADRLAEILSVKKSSVWRWVREGRIPYYRASKKTIRFDVGKVLGSMKSNGGDDACRDEEG
jgi:excisionase family DNA binding protein